LKTETKRQIKACGWVLFILYLGFLFYLLFFAEGYGRKIDVDQGYRYNFEFLREIKRFWVYRKQLGFHAVFVNIAGNVAAFVPFGLILPVIGRHFRSMWKVTGLGLLLSLSVELLQLVTKVGCCDVDDLLLNTIGALTGYLVFAVCNAFIRWKS
jgi:glycopeptide antibiotics resistance protein